MFLFCSALRFRKSGFFGRFCRNASSGFEPAFYFLELIRERLEVFQLPRPVGHVFVFRIVNASLFLDAENILHGKKDENGFAVDRKVAHEVVERTVLVFALFKEAAKGDLAVIGKGSVVLFNGRGVIKRGVDRGKRGRCLFEQFGFHTVLQNIHDRNGKFLFHFLERRTHQTLIFGSKEHVREDRS